MDDLSVPSPPKIMAIDILILPVLSSLIVIALLRLYCRLTVGICDCQQDMTGKTVLITGANSGIGKATALNLAQRNARVLMACRNLEKAEKVKSEIVTATGNTNVEIKHLDLESFSSVRKCAEEVLKTEKRLDVLINNAGVTYHDRFKTEDGCEATMQANHLGHFLLTLLLLDLLKRSRPSRIINVSSIIYFCAMFDIDDMDGSKLNLLQRHLGNFYFRAKLANILFTKELSRKLDGTGVTVNALHPGKSPEEGAQTTIYLAVHPDLEKTTGKFFYDCHEACLLGKAKDRTMARRLFEISEKLVGEKFKA